MQVADFTHPNQFPHPIDQIQWRETHISCLILTGSYVYKIKKPVNFGFLDFTDLAARKLYCEEEVRLNRRTAPQLYLGVEAVYQDDSGYNFCGRGNIADYAVKMQQFDPDALLANHMQDYLQDPHFFQSLGYQLATFHETAQVATPDQAFGTASAVRFPVEENFRQIMPRLEAAADIARLQALKYWSQDQCNQLAAQFDQRKQDGWVRECHGDLHLANIALIEGVTVPFDCIEFNERFRWIDVASDLAFLLMDMAVSGYREQANQLLNSYLEYSGDYDLLSVLQFYVVYRAMVRAKVAVLRMEQESGAAAEQTLQQFRLYLDFAEAFIEPGSRYLALTCGVSGTGKSTLARQLAAATNAIQLRSDVIRKQLVGLKPRQSSAELDPDNPAALYARHYSAATFERLQRLADQILQYGYGVIVDATFLQVSARRPFLQLVQQRQLPFKILYLELPVDQLRNRIRQRQQDSQDASEADVSVMERQLQQFEAFTAEEQDAVIHMPGELGESVLGDVVSQLSKL